MDCFVCKKELGAISTNIFTSSSLYSDTPLYKFFEIFLNLNSDDLLQMYQNDQENCQLCPGCNAKVNQYDQGITMADKAQHILTRLLHTHIQLIDECVESGDQDKIEEEPVTSEELIRVEVVNDEIISEQIDEVPLEPQQEPDKQINKNKSASKKRSYMKKVKEGFVCEFCSLSFDGVGGYEEHKLRHEGLSPLQCPSCYKSFTQKGALVRHMSIHTNEAQFFCSICGKTFIHYSSFHMHRLIHDDVRDKKCQTCGKTFRSNSHLRRHERVHSLEKPFECPVCGLCFAQRYNMTSHYKAHQGIPRKSSSTKSKKLVNNTETSLALRQVPIESTVEWTE